MKALSIATILAVTSFAVVPVFANEDNDGDYIHGRSEFAVQSALRDRGVAAHDLEEWGTMIRAYVPDGNGGTTMRLFDADTLEPIPTARG